MTIEQLDLLLSQVQKPARYTAGEMGAVIKTPGPGMLRYALCFPDLYEVGMSHLGMKILYAQANARPDVWCERVFAPDVDMENAMREFSVPLYGLESLDAIGGFDLIGFTLQYEMSYTAVLNMLDLAGLPVRTDERKEAFRSLWRAGPASQTRSRWPVLSTFLCSARARRSAMSCSTSARQPGAKVGASTSC
jgi:hypothetical protein